MTGLGVDAAVIDEVEAGFVALEEGGFGGEFGEGSGDGQLLKMAIVIRTLAGRPASFR